MFLKKLLKLVIKKGKKGIAVKFLIKALRGLRPYFAPSEVETIIKKLSPLVKIYKKKVAGKVYQLPWHSSPNRSAFQAAKWIMLGVAAERKNKNLSVKIGKQIVKTSKDKGVAIKLREQFVSVIKENRSYMRFIRRKRFKRSRKFKGRFKNRFTKKSVNYQLDILLGRKPGNFKKKNNKKKFINGKNNSKKISTKNKKYRR